jgi:hypothetical protein
MNNPRTIQEALAELEGTSLEEHRREEAHKAMIRARGENFRLRPPSEWPQLAFNWDLSQGSQYYVYDACKYEEFARLHSDGLALGYVDLSEFDARLCHFNRRHNLDELWKRGNASKLCYVLAHLEAGLPITPPLVSVVPEGLCFAGGNHRYSAAKFSGEMLLPIYVESANVKAVQALVNITWKGI